MAGRNAAGGGSIRKKTVIRNGKEYQYWEARVTVGHDPATGKQIQKSFTAKTQREVREKMNKAAVEVTEGSYKEESRITVKEWADIWLDNYLLQVKPTTKVQYKTVAKNHIISALGRCKLADLKPYMIQKLYNDLSGELSVATVRSVAHILRAMLECAVKNDMIKSNPAVNCVMPKKEKSDIQVLSGDEIPAFLEAVKGNKLELLFKVALFTGMRAGEILGLSWDEIDFDRGEIEIRQQLQLVGKEKMLLSPKSGKSRLLHPAPIVMEFLKAQKKLQDSKRAAAGRYWSEKGLVFTSETGGELSRTAIRIHFKKAVSKIGRPEMRFHDLRHSYAVASIQAGDDIKTIQENLGHSTAAFTMDIYLHVTDHMKVDSSNRMQRYIEQLIREK